MPQYSTSWGNARIRPLLNNKTHGVCVSGINAFLNKFKRHKSKRGCERWKWWRIIYARVYIHWRRTIESWISAQPTDNCRCQPAAGRRVRSLFCSGALLMARNNSITLERTPSPRWGYMCVCVINKKVSLATVMDGAQVFYSLINCQLSIPSFTHSRAETYERFWAPIFSSPKSRLNFASPVTLLWIQSGLSTSGFLTDWISNVLWSPVPTLNQSTRNSLLWNISNEYCCFFNCRDRLVLTISIILFVTCLILAVASSFFSFQLPPLTYLSPLWSFFRLHRKKSKPSDVGCFFVILCSFWWKKNFDGTGNKQYWDLLTHLPKLVKRTKAYKYLENLQKN